MTQVQERATFPAAAVEELLATAGPDGQVVLAKDEGAYLIAYRPDGTPVIVYATGHEPPPATGPDQIGPDDPWFVARQATERVWGGDDFTETFKGSELSGLQGSGDFEFTLTLEHTDIEPGTFPPGPWGEVTWVRHLQDLSVRRLDS